MRAVEVAGAKLSLLIEVSDVADWTGDGAEKSVDWTGG